MRGKRNVSVCRGHEFANALYISSHILGSNEAVLNQGTLPMAELKGPAEGLFHILEMSMRTNSSIMLLPLLSTSSDPMPCHIPVFYFLASLQNQHHPTLASSWG